MNNIWYTLLALVGATLLSMALNQQYGQDGALASIATGVAFIVVSLILVWTQKEEYFIKTEDWNDKVAEFVKYNRKVITIMLLMIATPFLGIGGGYYLMQWNWGYTVLIGLALVISMSFMLLRRPDNLDGGFGTRRIQERPIKEVPIGEPSIEQVREPRRKRSNVSCPSCGAQVPKSPYCLQCGADMNPPVIEAPAPDDELFDDVGYEQPTAVFEDDFETIEDERAQ